MDDEEFDIVQILESENMISTTKKILLMLLKPSV